MACGLQALRLLASAAVCCAVAGVPVAMARDAAPAFSQPAMQLDRALAGVADRAGIQLLFDPAMVQGRTGPALHGVMTPQLALNRLLSGTGLEAIPVDGKVFLIRRETQGAPSATVAHRRSPIRLPDARPDPPDAALWPEIIVTAARYRQSRQKISTSVEVIAGRDLAQQAVTNVSQALSGMSGISTSSQPGGASINLRGLGADMPSGTTQGSVALEFDGVYSIMALGTGTGWFDIDRVEVSKGPQSTRYGPNAEGGVVNVITRAPVLGNSSGFLSVTGGSANLLRTEFGQNLPLGTTVALRLSGVAVRRDSWFTPALANLITQSLRARLLVQPSDQMAVTLSAQSDHIGGTGTGAETSDSVLLDKVAPYAASSINANGNPWAQGDRASGSYDPASSRADVWQTTLSGHLKAGPWSGVVLDAVVAWLGIAGSQVACVRDGAPWSVTGSGSCYGVHAYAPYRQVSAEVRLHSPEDAAWHWDIGQYLWDFSKSQWADSGQSIAGPAGGSQIGTRTMALFAESTMPLLRGFRLVAGLRESWDHRELRPAAVPITYRRDFQHTDLRLGYEVDVTSEILHYTTLSTGYRPGGISYDGSTGAALGFDSQTTTALESGLKSTWAGGRLQVDLAGFAYRQRHYQDIDNYNGFSVTLGDDTAYVCQPGAGQPPACSVPVFTIARASNIGLEWQMRYHLTGHDSVSMDGTLMRARFGKNLSACASVAAPTTPGCWIGYNDQQTGVLKFFLLDGSAQPHAPTLSLGLHYDHAIDLKSGAQIVLGAQGFHSSGYWVGPVQDAALLGWQPAYWQAGLTMRFTLPGDRLDLIAYVHNLTNYAVKMSALPATTIGDPRNAGVTAILHW